MQDLHQIVHTGTYCGHWCNHLLQIYGRSVKRQRFCSGGGNL